MSPKNKRENALGKGLDALIRRDYLEEEERLEEKTEEPVKEIKPAKTEEAAKESKEPKETKGREEAKNTKTRGSKEFDEVQSKEHEKDEGSEEFEKGGSETSTEIKTLNVDEKVVEDVLLEVHKNPRISLWSARSAAVLRFLKKTKPEFSISNEASLLIEAAVKDRHPDLWRIFEEKGL